MECEFAVKQVAQVFGQLLAHTRNEYCAYVAVYDFNHFEVGFFLAQTAVGRRDEVVVLCAYHYCVDAHGLSAFMVVFNSYLAFRVGAQVGHVYAFAAYSRQFFYQCVA